MALTNALLEDGVDVSHHQNDAGGIDWKKVSKNYKFAFIKLTEGETFIDPKGRENVEQAKKHGMIVGGYHFARYKDVAEAKREAAFYKSHAKDLGLDFVINDLEHAEDMRDHHITDISDATNAFMESISEIGKPLLYTYPSFMSSYLNPAADKWDLWIAHYGVSSPSIGFFSDWKVWQYSSSARIDGMHGNIDVNHGRSSYLGVEAKKSKPKAKKSSHSTALLKMGDKGAKVRELQTHLLELGFYKGKIDGIFGHKTHNAVVDLQRDAHIGVDGIVGPKTLAAIDHELRFDGTLLVLHSHDYMKRESVKTVQRLLKLLHHDIKVDGIYGPNTEKAVQAFQKSCGLKTDGKVGPKTWKAMFGV